jgi:glycosyltransferase involved in cell wall biosynthesis
MRSDARPVLYISPNATGGGAETFLFHAAKFHDRARYEPVFWFLRRGPLVERVRALGVEAVEAPVPRLRSPLSILRHESALVRFVRARGIGLVHSTLAYGHLFGWPAARLTGAKEVWFQHGPVGEWLDLAANRLPADLILVPSAGLEREVARKIPSAKIVACNPAVDLGEATATLERSSLGLRESELVVAIAARFQPGKGLELVFDAFDALAKRVPGLRGLLIGDSVGPRDSEYAARIRSRAERDSRWVLTGWVPSAMPYFALADAVVSGSIVPEGFPIVALEAKAVGRPFVAPARGGFLEIFEDGKTGLLYPPGDSASLARQLERLLSDPALRRAVGEAARRDALARHSAEAMVRRLETFYDGLIAP